MRGIIEYFLDKGIFINLLTALLLLIGGFKAASMNREAFPNINFDIVTITTVYPGASPAEVEKLVTNPIEEAIKAVDGIKEYRSGSIENRSGIVITIDPNVDDPDKVVEDIQSAVDGVEDLPEDAKKPLVQEITSSRTPVIEVSIGGVLQDGKPILSEKQLKEQAEILEDMILELPDVGRIVRKGYRNTEMHVDVNPELLDRFSISPEVVINALNKKNINFPGGNIIQDGKESIVRTVGEFNTPEEIENVYLRSNDAGRYIRLGDVANAREDFEDAVYLDKVNSLFSIVLTVIKKEKGDAISLVDQVKEIVDHYQENYSYRTQSPNAKAVSFFVRQYSGYYDMLKENRNELSIQKIKAPPSFWDKLFNRKKDLEKRRAENDRTIKFVRDIDVSIGVQNIVSLAYVNDMSKYIRRRLNVLVSNGVTGFFLVVTSLFFFLGWRISLMVAIGLPLTIAMSFIAIDAFGLTLNLISMMGLIIVVGMLVDDAIIISENIFRYIEEGMDPREACIKGTHEVIAPVTATISTTTAAFAPLLFMSGIFGKFVFSIPLVVIIALASSLLEAFFVLPLHVYDVTKNSNLKQNQQDAEGKAFIRFREKIYRPVLSWCLRHKYLTVLILNFIFFFCIGLLVNFGRFKLFPGGVEVFRIKYEAQTGMTLEETEKFARAIEATLDKLPEGEVENHITRVGIQQKDANDPFTKRGKHFANLIVYLTPDDDRNRTTEDIITDVRNKTQWLLDPKLRKDKTVTTPPKEFAQYAGKLVALDFEKMQGGPPVGKPIAIEITGDDFTVLQEIGEKYKEKMRAVDGVTDIDDDYITGKDEIQVSINEGLASQAGVSIFQIATAINTAFNGTVATTIKRADEEVDVRVRFPEKYRDSISALNKLSVMNQVGNLIPVSRMLSFKTSPSVMSINHLDGKRLLTVTSNVNEKKITSRAANIQIKEKTFAIANGYPGYRIRFGGENKDTEESLQSLGRAFLVAFIIIFMILASLFGSLIQPIIVVAAIPFSFIGVIIAFVTHGHYFSFLSMIGIVGLSGIVVNDSIVLVDFANKLRAEHPEYTNYDVMLEAGLIRLRPVLLTTVTTVLGILPTAYGVGGEDPFLVPMAMAIGWGLAFASFLILLVIPVLYVILFDIFDWFGKKQRKGRDYMENAA
ncbi:MAG: efflux RND transporter permease subunit [Spirochaetota bacterium]